MTEGVLGMIMFAATSSEAWETLSGVFASTSIARSSVIQHEMAELKKGSKTVNAYFHLMKVLLDSLTSIGEPLHDAEFSRIYSLDLMKNMMSCIKWLLTAPLLYQFVTCSLNFRRRNIAS
jgi:hypothetical protein